MRKTFRRAGLVLLLGLVMPAIAAAQQAEKKRVAVGEPRTDWYHSDSCRGWAPNFGSTLTASLRSHLTQTGAYVVLNRDQMAKVLQEHSLSMNGMADPNTAKAVGKFLQADLLMAVELLCFPTYLEVTVTLVDVETTAQVWSKPYQLKNMGNMAPAIKSIAKLMKDYAKTGSMGESGGKVELFQRLDAKRFHAGCELMVGVIRAALPQVSGKIKEINTETESLMIKLGEGAGSAWAGLRMRVVRGDEEIGTLYLKKKGPGTVEAAATEDISAFEEGDKATTEGWEPSVAVGNISDENNDDEELLNQFADRFSEILGQTEGLKVSDDSDVTKVIRRMGEKTNKKDLEKLHKAGVDLLLTGRFVGEEGNRDLSIDIINTFDGKRLTQYTIRLGL